MEGSSYLSDNSRLLGIFDPSACNELEAEIVEILVNSARIEITGYRLIIDVPFDLIYFENKICDRRLLIPKIKLVAFVGKTDNVMQRLTLKNITSLEATVIKLENNSAIISQNDSQIRVERSFISGAELGVSVGDKVTLIKTLDRYIGCYLKKEPYQDIRNSPLGLIQKHHHQPDLRENLQGMRSIDIYGPEVQGKLAEDLIRNSPFNSVNQNPGARHGEGVIQPDLGIHSNIMERISSSSGEGIQPRGEVGNKQIDPRKSRLEGLGDVWADHVKDHSGPLKSGDLYQSQILEPSNPNPFPTNLIYKPLSRIEPQVEGSINTQATQPPLKPQPGVHSVQPQLKPESSDTSSLKLTQPLKEPRPDEKPAKPQTGVLNSMQVVEPSSSNVLLSTLVYNAQLPPLSGDQKLNKPELSNPAPSSLIPKSYEEPHQIAKKPNLFSQDVEPKPKDLPNPKVNSSGPDSKIKKGCIQYSKKLANLSLSCLNLILEISQTANLRGLNLSKLYSDTLGLSLKDELENIKSSELSELYELEDKLKGFVKSTEFSEKVNICRECWKNQADIKLECGHSLCRQDLVKLVNQHSSSANSKSRLIRCAFCPKPIGDEYITNVLKILPSSNPQPSDLPKSSHIPDLVKPPIPQSDPLRQNYLQDIIEPSRSAYMQDIKPQIPQSNPPMSSNIKDLIKPQIYQSNLPQPSSHHDLIKPQIPQPEPSRPAYMQDIKPQIPQSNPPMSSNIKDLIKPQIYQSNLPQPSSHHDLIKPQIPQPEPSRPNCMQDIKPQIPQTSSLTQHYPYSNSPSIQDLLNNPQIPQSVSFDHHNPYASESAAKISDPKPVIREDIYQVPYISDLPVRGPDSRQLSISPICQNCRKPNASSVHKCLCDKCYDMLINQGITDCRFCKDVLIEHKESNQCDNCHLEIDYSNITAGLNCENHKLCLTCIQKSVIDTKCVFCQRPLEADETQLLVDCYAGLCTICGQFYFSQYLAENTECNCRICMNCKHQYGDQVKNVCSCNLNKPKIVCTYCKNECSQDHTKLDRCKHIYCTNCKRIHLSTLIQDKKILTDCDKCSGYLKSELAKIRPQEERKQSTNLITCNICTQSHSDEAISKLECNHSFCNTCLKEYLQYWITSDVIGRFIECPICKNALKLSSIQRLDESLCRLYQANISRRLGMSIFCPKCYILINPGQSITVCQNEDCSFQFCIKCLSDKHEQNCDEGIKYAFIENVRSVNKVVVCCSGCATPNFYDEKLGIARNICRNPECNMMICDECGVLRCKIVAHGDSMHQQDCVRYNARSFKQGFDPYKCLACKRLGRFCSER
jgi:hypothetical protein